MSKSFLTKLSSGLDLLDGAFKEMREGDLDEQPLDTYIDQRKKRKQRIELAKEAAPYGSALGQPLASSSPPSSASSITAPFVPAEGGRMTHSSSSSSLETSSASRSVLLSVLPPTPPPPMDAADPPVAFLDVSTVAAAPSTIMPSILPPPAFPDVPVDGLDVTSASVGYDGDGLKAGIGARSRRFNAGSNSPASISGEGELKGKLRELAREIKELNDENAELERRILGQEKELKAAVEALQHYQAKAAAREEELLDEIRELRSAKDTDRRQYTAAMASKDKAVADMEADLAGAKAEVEVFHGQVVSLRKEITSILEDKEKLRQDLEVALANQERGVEGLQAELQAALNAMDEMKLQHTAWMRQAQRREADLEGVTAELTESIASKQREIDGLRAAMAAHGSSGGSQSSDLEMHRLQQELQATQGSLELERQHVITLQREFRALQHELSSAQAAWREEKEAAELRLQKAMGRTSELERIAAEAQRVARESKAQPSHRDREEHDARIKALSEQLVRKQEQLDAALCDKYALEARLKSAGHRLRVTEGQLADARNSADFDVEAGTGDSMGARNRGGRKHMRALLRPMSRFGPIARNPRVARAVDVLDRITLAVGHYLRVYPLARLAFVLYLILVNAWAFCLILFHSQRLEEVHGDLGGSFSNPAQLPPSLT